MEALWWAGLIGSWVAILVVVKLLILMLRVTKHARRLAELTERAAAGMARNTTSPLAAVRNTSRQLSDAARDLASSAAAVERRLGSMSGSEAGS
jgi:HAMP domain-containing protein